MKRLAAGIGGAVYGLMLTIACLYAVDVLGRRVPGGVASGCHELGKCPMSWLDTTLLALIAFGPSVLFVVLNMVAYRRFTIQSWLGCFGLATILIIGLYAILAF